MFIPTVLITFFPPMIIPKLILKAQAMVIQRGITINPSGGLYIPRITREKTIIAMVVGVAFGQESRTNSIEASIWSHLNSVLIRGGAFLERKYTPFVMRYAQMSPIKGATIKTRKIIATFFHCTILRPWATIPAPTNPPISECDADMGKPIRVQMRFHKVAPRRVAITIMIPYWSPVMTAGFIMPWASVLATAVPKK